MSVLSELGANYKSPSVTFPYKTGSVGNIFTPNFNPTANIASGANTLIVNNTLTAGAYSIQGYIEIVPTAGTLDDVVVTIQSADKDGVLQTVGNFPYFVALNAGVNNFVPISVSIIALSTLSPNFTIAIDGTTSGADVYGITNGTLTITKIA